MTVVSLHAVASEAFCLLECGHWKDGKLSEAALVTAMVGSIKKQHAKLLRLERDRMLTALCKRVVDGRIHRTRPSAQQIRRVVQTVSGQLPIFDRETVLNETLRLANGQTMRLADMSLAELDAVIQDRERAIGDEQVILGRLRQIRNSMVARGVTHVRGLFAA